MFSPFRRDVLPGHGDPEAFVGIDGVVGPSAASWTPTDRS
jgi:hypothetical protein